MSEVRYTGEDMDLRVVWSRTAHNMRDGIASSYEMGPEAPFVSVRVSDHMITPTRPRRAVFASISERLRSAYADPDMVFEESFKAKGRLCLVQAVGVLKLPATRAEIDAVAALALVVSDHIDDHPFEYMPRTTVEYAQAATPTTQPSPNIFDYMVEVDPRVPVDI